MRRIFAVTLTLAIFFLTSCSSSKNAYVPFTKDLKAKLEKQNIDLKQVQFYTDQKLILTRNLGDQKLAVSSGVVRLEKGQYLNEIIIPAFTPGICDSAGNERLLISFEKGSNYLAFGPGSGYTFNEFSIYGAEWRNGTAAVAYDNNKYRARCGSCQDVASVTLVVKRSDINKIERKSRTLKGRTVSK